MDTILEWNGTSHESGTLAVLLGPSAIVQVSDEPRLFVKSSASGIVFTVRTEQLAEFLVRHTGHLVVCVNADVLHWRFYDYFFEKHDRTGLAELWKLSNNSCLIDIGLMDRFLRRAQGDPDFRLRGLPQLATERVKNDSAEKDDASRDLTPACGNNPIAHELQAILRVFECLHAEFYALQLDSETPRHPVVEKPPPTSELDAESQAKMQRLRRELLKRHRPRIIPQSKQDVSPDHEQQASVEKSDPTEPEALDLNSTGLSGVGVEVRGAIALARLGQVRDDNGLRIDQSKLPLLLLRADQKYQESSEIIANNPSVKECFNWKNERFVTLTRNQHPVSIDDKLGDWLKQKAQKLCTLQNQPAPIPKRPDGRTSLNPEYWGIWPGCDRELNAWRNLYRMAELSRLTNAGAIVRPRYQTVPALRSLEPNLAVYRKLNVPIFRPREGYRFLAGQVTDLRIRCMVKACLKQGYAPRGHPRSATNLLRQKMPLSAISRDLYVEWRVSEAEGPDGRRSEGIRSDATAEFMAFLSNNSDEYLSWLELTDALLQLSVLGLPGSLLSTMLEHEFEFDRIGEVVVERLVSLLANEVVFELDHFLRDETEGIVGANLGLSPNAVVKQLVNLEHLDTSGAALRNRLLRRKPRSPRLPESIQTAASEKAGQAVHGERPRRELFEYRAITLGGRPTIRASQAAVRQQEVLLASDEVMMEVAYALVTEGHQLLAIAGDEFVVEVPASAGDLRQTELGKLASHATVRILGDMAAPVRIEVCDFW